ncbi:MAG: 30S ribosomal protein S19 [Candidatus Nealsonbacteria bacterium CG_4_8_14_3_um_filter_39_7]|uniref:Small ribosomal subunit protein uS19 n=1 Tax=Candidatus Nealsonbacteria bacterium CG23_combo_of_CG06-09_8_20_14_all_39_17 TaxID=1974722 RepID=A0A2G9YTT1_9BACT|nr:MAG: 30S ribosomal protein S19 [Candidatus Nealsonbacteria bacterium CG23_combo_of_CG06-09_8_20_14_all_39_17]PIU43926.1 MAG: 30S ribosomal protein S19 [Candidatus Nealsonbacteria bacterium CG07_land_8_20_14_0_80_39_13]PIW91027.1 MAG: 30S ribosomal protein S19 [Candidatus Nealsonbacteria bacterium CG_4_8_14_3_um_filter_39_7]
MSRSLKKGPFVDERLTKKLKNLKAGGKEIVKTWSRSCTITPEMINYTFGVHNGKDFIQVQVNENMVGHKLGEFSPTTKFSRHGGRMQKDLEKGAEQKGSEQAKAKGAKA